MTREEVIRILKCDGFTSNPIEIDEALKIAIQALEESDIPHGKCKTCKHYIPYRDQFSYENRGDGYCKSTITTSEGNVYINCHDEWYCANYEKEGDEE